MRLRRAETLRLRLAETTRVIDRDLGRLAHSGGEA